MCPLQKFLMRNFIFIVPPPTVKWNLRPWSCDDQMHDKTGVKSWDVSSDVWFVSRRDGFWWIWSGRWLQKRSVSCKCVLLWMSKGCAWSRSHCTTVCPRFLWHHAAHCVSLRLTGSLCWFVLFSHKLSDSCYLHPDPRQLWTGPQNNAAVTRPWEHTFNHTIIIRKTSGGHVWVVFHPKIRRNIK